MKKILIADDEIYLRFVLREMLQNKDYDIYEAENGEQALEMTRNINPDIILLDSAMPRMTGIEVIETLCKEHNKRCKVIMLSAKAQKTDIELGLEKGADYYVTKPFDLFKLTDLIDEVISH